MVAVAQLVEPLTVTQVVVGSSPIGHPIQVVHNHNKKPRISGVFLLPGVIQEAWALRRFLRQILLDEMPSNEAA